MQNINYYAKLKYLIMSLESLSLCYKNTSRIYYKYKKTSLLQNLRYNKSTNQYNNILKDHSISTIHSIYYIYNNINTQHAHHVSTRVLQNQELLNQYINKFCNIYYKNFHYYTLDKFDAKYIAYYNLYTIHKIATNANMLYLIYYLIF